MKKSITCIIVIIGLIVTAYLAIRPSDGGIIHQEPTYAYAEDLKGLGPIKMGSSLDEVTQVLDSNYLNYHDVIRKNGGSIDFVSVSRNKMLQYVGPSLIDTPDTYNTDYRRYRATLIISERLAVEDVELYFWHDTLHKITLLNRIGTDEVGEGLIHKYGEGVGPKKKTSSRIEEVHRWGNDLCVATYVRDITYTLNSQCLASGVQSWFRRIDITLSDERMNKKIENYLNHADSLHHADRYSGI